MNPNIYSNSTPQSSAESSVQISSNSGFFERVKTLITRREVSEKVVKLHHQSFTRIQQIGMIAKAIDKAEFRDPEFLFFMDVKNRFLKGIDEYRGLNHSLRLLRVAVDAQHSFLNIEQIELIYRGKNQQEFYDLVFDLLSRDVTTHYFYQKIREKFTEVFPKIRTKKGQKALQAYMQALDALAKQDQLGLKLLFLFKKYQLNDYSILRRISEMIGVLKNQEIRDINTLIQMVNRNYYIFEHLGKIIGVPSTRSNAKTYGLMLQYLVLRHKYQKSYIHFEKLLRILKDWEKCYAVIQDIRQQHPLLKYKQPQEFKVKPQGLSVYQAYKPYLS